MVILCGLLCHYQQKVWQFAPPPKRIATRNKNQSIKLNFQNQKSINVFYFLSKYYCVSRIIHIKIET